ncbi:hypothetical protein D3C72_685210 [compost metagenome]
MKPLPTMPPQLKGRSVPVLKKAAGLKRPVRILKSATLVVAWASPKCQLPSGAPPEPAVAGLLPIVTPGTAPPMPA